MTPAVHEAALMPLGVFRTFDPEMVAIPSLSLFPRTWPDGSVFCPVCPNDEEVLRHPTSRAMPHSRVLPPRGCTLHAILE